LFSRDPLGERGRDAFKDRAPLAGRG